MKIDCAPVLSDPRVLLVSCYEMGHAPLGLEFPTAVLASRGLLPTVNDIAVEPLDETAVSRATFIAISAPMHTALRLGIRLARHVRSRNPTAHIAFYGLYASLCHDTLRSECDSVARTDDELADRVFDVLGDTPAGVVPQAQPLRATLPDLSRYTKLFWRGALHTVGYTVTTSGCKHECRHCPLPPVFNGRFRAIALDRVIEGIAERHAAGARHITFGDPDFFNGPTHARRVVQAMHDRFPDLTFDYTAKITHLDRHRSLVEWMAARGNLFVVSAVESFHDGVLDVLAKGHTRADALRVIAHFRSLGLTLRPSFVPFTPWESLSSYVDLLRTIEREDLVDAVDPVQYSIRLLVPEGSLLLSMNAMTRHIEEFDREHLTYRWHHPDPAMDDLQRSIAGIAERAAADGDDIARTYASIRDCAESALAPGLRQPLGMSAFSPITDRPRLTEAWFC